MAGKEDSNTTDEIKELRKYILDTKDFLLKKVYIPEWDCQAWLKVISGFDRERFEKTIQDQNLNGYVRATLVQMSLCNSNGDLVFLDSDVRALAQKNSAVIDRLFDMCMDISALTKEATDEIEKE